VEVMKDVAFRVHPLSDLDAHEMVRGIKGFTLLNGFRGKPKADLAAIEKLLVCLSDLVMDNPEIRELDINPLLAHDENQGATVADCRFILDPADA